jgi:predicted metal-binding protein
MDQLQAVRICPVTNGLPTTMTLEGFKAACERCREQDRHTYYAARGYKFTWCDVCQGKMLPKELRVMRLQDLEQRRTAKSREMLAHSPARQRS